VITPNEDMLKLLRVRIGLPADDASKDAIITAAYGAAGSLLENYLDRSLQAGEHSEQFTHIANNVVSLRAYPIDDVTTIVTAAGAEITAYHVEKSNGLIHFDSRQSQHEIMISYTSLDPVDAVLGLALLSVFDQTYTSITAVSSGGAVSGGAIKSISSDGARIEYVSGTESSVGIDSASGLPSGIIGLLQAYRRQSC
jgi:hypothetical protein